ncbi:MAG: transglutaminase-like domain-containing protein [Hyphomicrobiaceae bacterium]
MQIRTGYEIAYECPQATPMILMLTVHPSRQHDLATPHRITLDPPVAAHDYSDIFGNVCTRIVAPPGRITISADFIVNDHGTADQVVPSADQVPVQDLPGETLTYLLGSRYCDTDHLSNTAWSLFGHGPAGWARVQAICDYVHDRLTFGYQHASVTRTAWDGFNEQRGVCRDFAHLAITLCRCMNIPARYCTGYLGDIGVPVMPEPMDFSAWFEVYLDGGWYTFDARHNKPRIGRILVARGRDATDVALSTAFGTARLAQFKVVTDEIAV